MPLHLQSGISLAEKDKDIEKKTVELALKKQL